MADIPGLKADVYFGDPEKDALPNWREEDTPENEDDTITAEERAFLAEQLGFDPAEMDHEPRGLLGDDDPDNLCGPQ